VAPVAPLLQQRQLHRGRVPTTTAHASPACCDAFDRARDRAALAPAAVGVYLRVPGAAPRAVRALSVYEVENELRPRVRGRVVLRTDGRHVVFLYTDTHDAAVAAQQAAGDLLAERGMPAQIVIECRHPIAEQWEPPGVPLPPTRPPRRRSASIGVGRRWVGRTSVSRAREMRVLSELPDHLSS
jgi:hypothetical protein